MMKANLFIISFLISNAIFSQGSSTVVIAENNTSSKYYTTSKTKKDNNAKPIGSNGFEFNILDAGVNTKYSEIGTGFFRNKLIMVSSKKLGGLAKIDPNTKEAYKDLYCVDVSSNGTLKRPLLFSRILNTAQSEDQLTFSPDQKTIYYTRSSKENSLEYKLYKATLEEDSHGNWINNELLSINEEGASIENPFLNEEGNKLYFSSNMKSSIGGFDIYMSNVNPDGSIESPQNLGHIINTTSDDKYPSLSKDGKYLYFSSKGHKNMGGYDLFVSRILKNTTYKAPRNLGNTINTSYDEIAYFTAGKNKAYVSSNKPHGKGGFDIYSVHNEEVTQTIKGKTLDLVSKIALSNTLIILTDEDDNEVERLTTDDTGSFKFKNVIPYENYTLTTYKAGFKDETFKILASRSFETSYNKNLELKTTDALITKVDDELRIVLENIYFDFGNYTIKKESTISLNKVVEILNNNPEIRLAINAHTDMRGNDLANLKLSKARALSALNYLIKKGISKDRLESKGFGETKPLIDCKSKACSEEDHQSNRRIEFVILNK